MTIAISLKVNDGIVLASDSAATQMLRATGEVVNIYNNAIKIFRLHEDLPLGVVTWGEAGIMGRSLKVLAKDFRAEIMHSTQFNSLDYTMQEVAQKFKEFMFDLHYQHGFTSWAKKPFIGFMVAGYASGQSFGEVWQILMDDGWCRGPSLEIPPNYSSVIWKGMPDSLDRLLYGFQEDEIRSILDRAGVESTQITNIIKICEKELGAPIMDPSMPIQDAIDLALFMARTASQYTRFCEGPDSVGGPIDVATLTKYEGFKWIRRKHFYDKALNT